MNYQKDCSENTIENMDKNKCFKPIIAKYKIEECSPTICSGNVSEKYYKEVPKNHYGEIQYDEKILSENGLL